MSMPSESDYLPTPSIGGVFDSLVQRSDVNTEHSSSPTFSTDGPGGAGGGDMESENSDSTGRNPDVLINDFGNAVGSTEILASNNSGISLTASNNATDSRKIFFDPWGGKSSSALLKSVKDTDLNKSIEPIVTRRDLTERVISSRGLSRTEGK